MILLVPSALALAIVAEYQALVVLVLLLKGAR